VAAPLLAYQLGVYRNAAVTPIVHKRRKNEEKFSEEESSQTLPLQYAKAQNETTSMSTASQQNSILAGHSDREPVVPPMATRAVAYFYD